ncbi:MAG: signal peptidase II [Patescibacteria group bacterium]|nr:signal peptidase II [Patescibacteria group bacterium]
MKRRRAKVIIGFAACVALMDAVFKWQAILRLPEEGGRLFFPIDFVLHKNPGIAFDIPIPLSIVVTFSILVSIVLIRFTWKNWQNNPNYSAAASMIVIGSLGNMFDRIINNFTTDYIILFGRSAINLSDILILTGAILLIRYTKK